MWLWNHDVSGLAKCWFKGNVYRALYEGLISLVGYSSRMGATQWKYYGQTITYEETTSLSTKKQTSYPII